MCLFFSNWQKSLGIQMLMIGNGSCSCLHMLCILQVPCCNPGQQDHWEAPTIRLDPWTSFACSFRSDGQGCGPLSDRHRRDWRLRTECFASQQSARVLYSAEWCVLFWNMSTYMPRIAIANKQGCVCVSIAEAACIKSASCIAYCHACMHRLV